MTKIIIELPWTVAECLEKGYPVVITKDTAPRSVEQGEYDSAGVDSNRFSQHSERAVIVTAKRR